MAKLLLIVALLAMGAYVQVEAGRYKKKVYAGDDVTATTTYTKGYKKYSKYGGSGYVKPCKGYKCKQPLPVDSPVPSPVPSPFVPVPPVNVEFTMIFDEGVDCPSEETLVGFEVAIEEAVVNRTQGCATAEATTPTCGVVNGTATANYFVSFTIVPCAVPPEVVRARIVETIEADPDHCTTEPQFCQDNGIVAWDSNIVSVVPAGAKLRKLSKATKSLVAKYNAARRVAVKKAKKTGKTSKKAVKKMTKKILAKRAAKKVAKKQG